MKKLLLIFLLFSVRAGATTYYIDSVAGADTNTSTQSQSKSTPWQHVPGMNCATSNSASYSQAAGDTFVIKGGSHFHASCWPEDFTTSGTSGSRRYLGVDLTWFNGGSWTRPIFDGDGTYPGTGTSPFVEQYGDYSTLDNIEFTGMFWSGNTFAKSYINNGGDHNIDENYYMHGWTHDMVGTSGCPATGTCDSGIGYQGKNMAGTQINNQILNSVCDGSDTAKDSFSCVYGGEGSIENSYFSYYTDAQGDNWLIHDTWFNNVVQSFAPGTHENAYQDNGGYCGPNNQSLWYNNLFSNVADPAQITRGEPSSSCTAYDFGSVLYNVTTTDSYQLGGTTAGAAALLNNMTIDMSGQIATSPSSCIRWVSSSGFATVGVSNVHCIYAAGGTGLITGGGTPTTTTNLTQLESVACGTYFYCNTQTPYVDAPTSGSSPTVNAGTNKSAFCGAIVNSAAQTACGSDTTYACAYNSSTHSVTCPARAISAWGSTWSIGAYKFAGGVVVPTAPGSMFTWKGQLPVTVGKQSVMVSVPIQATVVQETISCQCNFTTQSCKCSAN